jgi:hypothetical protein
MAVFMRAYGMAEVTSIGSDLRFTGVILHQSMITLFHYSKGWGAEGLADS